ncbi:MAG: benzoate/H(+) symporter BenE family transporter [Silvanigrellales bacterium]|nr:benzoate/H(+) symporter BenE family transporter [Silvanigrellales bacterium]
MRLFFQGLGSQLRADVSLSALVAGFVTVLVGFTSTGVIVFEAARALGGNTAVSASWLLAVCVGSGITTIGLSLWKRMPIATAWCTPGAAMLITNASGATLAEATGAFLVSGVLIALAGFTGLFERVLNHLPLSLASAMLAGVLLRFGLGAFAPLEDHFVLVISMFAAYIFFRRVRPRFAVLAAFAAGLAVVFFQTPLEKTAALSAFSFVVTKPVFIAPDFSISAFFGIALPLFAVTMGSQNVPGVAVMRAHGYAPPVSAAVGWTGAFNALLAPFGAFGLNLAAITAAICMGSEAHEDPRRRYIATCAAGLFYILLGLFGATISALFAAFPKELVFTLAGLALLNTIGNGLHVALSAEREREAALVTFLVTGSGLTLLGVGSAFWGLALGALTGVVLNYRRPRTEAPR